MAVYDFTDLDLKLASAEATLSSPQPPEIGSLGPFVTQLGDDQARFSNLQPSLPSENVELTNMKNGFLSELDVKTPVPISQHEPAQSPTESQSSKRRRKRGSGMELAVILDSEKNPDWLPVGWKVVTRTRPTGKSAGSKDTYYHEPVKNRQFRSKREVLEYLAGGSCTRPHKKLKNTEDAANTLPLQSAQPINFESTPPPEKPFKSSQPINYESAKPPEKVRWVLENSAGNLWTPFIAEERVPEHIKLEWAAMFNPFAHRNGGWKS